jgi:putative tryptophan/tyrosine transport system substrate-binding protein
MLRRDFLTLVGGGAATWPLAARAQQPGKMRRVGFLSGRLRPTSIEASALGGFTQGMRELGYVEGRDFVIEWRFAEGKYELFSPLAAELVRLNVDVIVVVTPSAVRPLQGMTTTIPIVMGFSTDPVGNGFVTSLARPGGNVTGLASSSDDASPKQLELLTVMVPGLSRVGILMNPGSLNNSSMMRGVQMAAQGAGLSIVPVEAANTQEIGAAFATLAKERVGAVMTVPDAFFNSNLKLIAELAISNRMPSIYSQGEYAEAGGLMSYGESLREFLRHAASFVDKIFKGAKAADIPIQQPTKFTLAINRKTANTLGLTIPQQLLMFADHVIE